jgi:hypothetical protein
MLPPSDRTLRASPAGVICSLPANEPNNDCERNRLPERCLLSSILGVGWPFPFHATQSERCVVESRGRRGRAILVANVVDFGTIAGPDFRGVGVESMDIRGNSGPCFVCRRSTRYFVDPVVSRCMTQRVAHLNLQPHHWVPLVSEDRRPTRLSVASDLCWLAQLVSAMGSAWCSPTCIRTI